MTEVKIGKRDFYNIELDGKFYDMQGYQINIDHLEMVYGYIFTSRNVKELVIFSSPDFKLIKRAKLNFLSTLATEQEEYKHLVNTVVPKMVSNYECTKTK